MILDATGSRSPVFYLHPDEVHWPAVPLATSYDFREWCKKNKPAEKPRAFDPLTPAYYIAVQDKHARRLAVTYWLYYNYSHVDIRSPFGFPDVAGHEGDWEWVGFFVTVDDAGNVDEQSIQHFVGQHTGTLNHETIPVTPAFEDTHPVFYVARKSHSNYITAGSRTGLDINPSSEPNPVKSFFLGLSKSVADQVRWDPRDKGPRWQPPVLPLIEQSWGLNRGRWGNAPNSPYSPILQLHKPSTLSSTRTPLAFQVTPTNLKFDKGTMFWNIFPETASFTTKDVINGPGRNVVARIAATDPSPARIWQDLHGDARAGDRITVRAHLRFEGEPGNQEPAKIKIVEITLPGKDGHPKERSSDVDIYHAPGQDHTWYEFSRELETNGPVTIHFEIHCPVAGVLLIDRLEFGIHSEGLVTASKDRLIAWNELWFGRR